MSAQAANAVAQAIPHGTANGYCRHKCRCADCREAEVARQRDWRKRLRTGQVRHRDTGVLVPVRIRDVDYPSIAIAASVLDVSPCVISGHLRRYGHADWVGQGFSAPRKPSLGKAKPCIIFEREFSSVTAAARYLDIGYSNLSRKLAKGLTGSYAQYVLGKMMAADARAARAAQAGAA